MTDLHAELAASTGCKVCAYLQDQAPSDALNWRRELSLPVSAVGNQAVADALGRRGVTVSEAAVRRHRRNHRGR